MGKVLHTYGHFEIYFDWNIYIYICINANCDHSFATHTDLEIQVPTVENLALSNVLHLRRGVGQSVAMHASPIAIYKLQSLNPLSVCPNYYLYAVIDGVADAVNIFLCLPLSSFFSFCPFVYFFIFSFCPFVYFFLRRPCVVDIKTQGLTIFVFILPLSVCHSLKRAKKLSSFIFYIFYYYIIILYF